jgi:hypothetical protein
VLALVDWKKVFSNLATGPATKGVNGLLSRLGRDESEKAAKQVTGLFAGQFLREVEDTTPLSSAVPGYGDDLRRLIEYAALEITSWLQPETKEVDLSAVERMWKELGSRSPA